MLFIVQHRPPFDHDNVHRTKCYGFATINAPSLYTVLSPFTPHKMYIPCVEIQCSSRIRIAQLLLSVLGSMTVVVRLRVFIIFLPTQIVYCLVIFKLIIIIRMVIRHNTLSFDVIVYVCCHDVTSRYFLSFTHSILCWEFGAD